jgi:cysteinyl-tRNA synthetase
MSARDAARLEKNWAEADRLRDLLLERGYEVKDRITGTKYNYYAYNDQRRKI